MVHFGKQKQAIITATERKSRFTLIINAPEGKKTQSVIRRLSEAIAPFNPKSITLDNGGEFTNHQDLPCKTFFCDPYSSWQKAVLRTPTASSDASYPSPTEVNSVTKPLKTYRITSIICQEKFSTTNLLNNYSTVALQNSCLLYTSPSPRDS